MASNYIDKKRSFTFEWRIDNFAHCSDRQDDSIFSPIFVADALDHTDWYLLLCPKRSCSENCALYLSRGSRGPDGIIIDYELAFLTVDESPNKISKCSDYFERNRLFGCHDFMLHEELFSTRRSSFLENDALTIQCHMRKHDRELKEEIQCFAYSRVGIDRRFFTWKMNQFSKLELGEWKTAEVQSPVPTNEPLILRASLEGTTALESFLRIQIGQENPNRKGILSCKISVIDSSGRVAKSKVDKYCLARLESGNFWDFASFITREELVDREGNLLPGDVLSLKCELLTTLGIEYETIDGVRYGVVTKKLNYDVIRRADRPYYHECYNALVPLSILQGNLLTLYREKTLSDIELRSNEIPFRAHRNVLSARSPVFKAMFTSKMKEAEANVIPIIDIEPDILERLLTFIYAGIINDLQWAEAVKLYYAADKYQILSLKEKCSSFLKSNLDTANVYDTLILADRHEDHNLKSAIQEFLLDHSSKIFLSEKWKEFMEKNLSLAAETMHLMFMELNFKKV